MRASAEFEHCYTQHEAMQVHASSGHTLLRASETGRLTAEPKLMFGLS